MKLTRSLKIILLSVLLIGDAIIAQSGSSYTRYGLGDIDYSYSVRRLGMGQLGTSIADVDFISTSNPASLYRMSKTRIEFSLKYNGTFLSNDRDKNYFAETDFGGFTVGIPISSTYGIAMAFGLIPFSNVSYDVVEDLTSDNPLIGNYKAEYYGNGGLSKVFISSSYLLPIDLAIGASFDYYFGNINYNSRVDFISSSSFSSEYVKNYGHRGIGGTLGFISPDFSKILDIKSISDFRLGLAINLFSKLNNDTLFTAESIVGIDTLNSGQGKLEIPTKFTAGLSFILSNKYLFSIDYSSQAWSSYQSIASKSSALRNAYKISSGFEYRPLRELGSTFWEQIILRAGLSYEQTKYQINGIGINEYSVSLGASLPLSFENTLDIGLMYARRGTTESNLLQEDIIKLGIGFSLGELWFLRQDK